MTKKMYTWLQTVLHSFIVEVSRVCNMIVHLYYAEDAKSRTYLRNWSKMMIAMKTSVPRTDDTAIIVV